MEDDFQLVGIKMAYFNAQLLECYIEAKNIECEPSKREQIDKGNFWATRQQIGYVLGYKNPCDAVKDIHEQHKERLDKLSIVNTSIPPFVNLKGETFYNFRGLLEVCRYSNQPNADAVIDWLWDISNEIRNTQWLWTDKNIADIPKLPYVKGLFNAAERIIHKAVHCKTDEDFREVTALDKIFIMIYEYSALRLAGIQLTTERR